MSSIFTKIIKREIPAHIIYENENFIVILDAFPIVEGHTLVIPKNEVDKFYQLDEKTLKDMFVLSQKVSKAIEKAFACKRVGLSIVGLEVPHSHIHLLPINSAKDMDLNAPKLNLSSQQMSQIAEKIKKSLLL